MYWVNNLLKKILQNMIYKQFIGQLDAQTLVLVWLGFFKTAFHIELHSHNSG